MTQLYDFTCLKDSLLLEFNAVLTQLVATRHRLPPLPLLLLLLLLGQSHLKLAKMTLKEKYSTSNLLLCPDLLPPRLLLLQLLQLLLLLRSLFPPLVDCFLTMR